MASNKELLIQFSLTEDEAEIYLGLLKLGKTTVTELAKKIKKNRTATYFHVNKLVEKNVVRQSNVGRVLWFTAVGPSELAQRFDKLVTDFKSVVPQLEALQKIEVDQPRVQITESRAGFGNIYDEISSLPEGSTVLAMEGVLAMKNEFTLLTSEQTKKFYERMIERKIGVRLIMTTKAAMVLNTVMNEENRELLKQRILDIRVYDEMILPFHGLSLIYGDTLAQLFPETNLVVTIKHQGTADSFKAMFEGLFANGKVFRFDE